MPRVLLVVLGGLLLSSGSAAGQPTPAPRAPAHVAAFAEQVQTNLLDTLNIAEVLRPYCADITAHMRRSRQKNEYPVIATIDGKTLCDAIVSWATFIVELSAAVFSQWRLDSTELDAVPEAEGESLGLELLQRFFPSRRLRYDRRADTLWVGDPATGCKFDMFPFETKSELDCFLDAMRGFRGLKAQGVGWNTPVLAANLEYFRRHHDSAHRWPRVYPTAPPGYLTCRLGWCLELEDRGDRVAIVGFLFFDP